MIKSFEPVYKELEELLIHNLPEYIEKNNKEHNDGIILKVLENHALEEYCVKRPCFNFGIEEAEYSEKDSPLREGRRSSCHPPATCHRNGAG